MQYEFPLEIGQKWSPRFISTSRDGTRTSRWRWDARVDGAETVKVPAGVFDTLRIKLDGFYNGSEGTRSWTGRRIQTIWYSPVAKRTVKSEFEESSGTYRNVERMELMSYKLAQ